MNNTDINTRKDEYLAVAEVLIAKEELYLKRLQRLLAPESYINHSKQMLVHYKSMRELLKGSDTMELANTQPPELYEKLSRAFVQCYPNLAEPSKNAIFLDVCMRIIYKYSETKTAQLKEAADLLMQASNFIDATKLDEQDSSWSKRTKELLTLIK